MKEKITAFIDTLIIYDYILFGSSFVLFIIFIIISILARKKLLLAVFFVLISFGILILGPSIGYIKMHEYLFKNTTTLKSQKRLEYTNAIVVRGTLQNESKKDFSSCSITASVHKVSKNPIKKHLYKFKTLKKMSIVVEDIAKGESIDFKILVEPFTYKKDYNITLGAKCR